MSKSTNKRLAFFLVKKIASTKLATNQKLPLEIKHQNRFQTNLHHEWLLKPHEPLFLEFVRTV